MSNTPFSTLPLQPVILKNLSSLEYKEMTPIQEQSLPHILAGEDVIGQGKTGSGKTAAFGLGILEKINIKNLSVQALVICPTRELSDQVATEVRTLARTLPNIKIITLCGGVPSRAQSTSLEHGAHVVVGTPGRLLDFLEKKFLKLDNVQTLVLDEADRMLEMGFIDVIHTIVDQVPRQRQTLLFSATYPSKIEAIAKRVMKKPILVKVSADDDEKTITQYFYQANDDKQRITALKLLILKNQPFSTLVFCSTKIECQELADKLCADGFSALALHGDMEQKDRDQTLIQFSNQSVSILVATDVASRGLDIENIEMVVNYHLASDAEVHTHRIGRTGRAGRKGSAHSFFTDNQKYKISMFNEGLDNKTADVLPPMTTLQNAAPKPPYATIRIDSGKKQKIRAGDILGALTGDRGIKGDQVGKINVQDNWSYVAVNRSVLKTALKWLTEGKLKGRAVRAKLISSI